MFRFTKINNIKVKPIPLDKIPPEKIKGYELFPELVSTIFLVAHKKSGKTTTIFEILKKCTNKDTKLIFIGSTIYNDPVWKHIQTFFKKKGNPVLRYTSIHEGGGDVLQELMDALKEEGKVEKEEEEEEKEEKIEKPKKLIVTDDDEEEKEKRKKRPKKIAPDIIVVLDDLSKEMRTPSFNTFIKTHRHYRTKVIISSQNVKDIQPEARENINYLLIFKEIKDELLKTIYEDFNIKLDISTFVNLYKTVTQPKYSFLYIDVHNHLYRQNFNILIEPPERS